MNILRLLKTVTPKPDLLLRPMKKPWFRFKLAGVTKFFVSLCFKKAKAKTPTFLDLCFCLDFDSTFVTVFVQTAVH